MNDNQHSYFLKEVVDGHILVVTINRTEARNAFNLQMAQQFEAIWDEYEADRNLWVAIIQSKGPVFSAGQDLKAAQQGELAVTEKRGPFGYFRMPPEKPVIAAVEGKAFAGGIETVLTCDMVVASRAAEFALRETKQGLMAGGAGCFRLPRRIPRNIAMEMVMAGNSKSAEEMFGHGLINRLAAPGEALDEALSLARLIAQNSPIAVKCSREVVFRAESEAWDEDAAWQQQNEIHWTVRQSKDHEEGLAAFIEKRDPVWTNS